jgi:hypothetical protein
MIYENILTLIEESEVETNIEESVAGATAMFAAPKLAIAGGSLAIGFNPATVATGFATSVLLGGVILLYRYFHSEKHYRKQLEYYKLQLGQAKTPDQKQVIRNKINDVTGKLVALGAKIKIAKSNLNTKISQTQLKANELKLSKDSAKRAHATKLINDINKSKSMVSKNGI